MKWLLICAILPGLMAEPSQAASGKPAKASGAGCSWKGREPADIPGRARVWREAIADHLQNNLLGFWLKYGPDREYGGFHGVVSREGKPELKAHKSLILTSRIVWTFSAAYRAFPREEYRKAAADAYSFMEKYYWDSGHGGWLWSVSRSGGTLDAHKYLYGQSFAIYALAEYARAFNDKHALELGMKTFELMEKHAHDAKYGGYMEPFTRDWKPETKEHPIGPPDQKSTNTHLHLMESFTNLYRAGGDKLVRERLEEVYGLIMTRISDPSGYAIEYFRKDWTPIPSPDTSYGHEVEEAWLLLDAVDALGGPREECARLAKALVDRSMKYGFDHENGGLYERGPWAGPATKKSKTWWAQAECMVGLLAVYDLTKDPAYLSAFDQLTCWIFDNLVDPEYGEWYQDVAGDGKVDKAWKVTPWKCPYHNARACLESIRRLDAIAAGGK